MGNKIGWKKHLKQQLKDPEFAAHFANAQQESLKKLNRTGILPVINLTSLEMNKTTRLKWKLEV